MRGRIFTVMLLLAVLALGAAPLKPVLTTAWAADPRDAVTSVKATSPAGRPTGVGVPQGPALPSFVGTVGPVGQRPTGNFRPGGRPPTGEDPRKCPSKPCPKN